MVNSGREKKRILFYSSVKSKKMFSVQKFYRTDILILKELGYNVVLSNSFFDFLHFWKYDYSFIYFYRYGLIPALFSKIFRKPVIFTGGIDFLDKEYASFKSYLVQAIFFVLCHFFSNKNILVSSSDKKNVEKFRLLLNKNKLKLSFHVIDVERYFHDNFKGKEKILCTVCWMLKTENVLRKGVDKSLYFFKALHNLDQDFRMIIIGPTGEGTDFLKDIIKKEKLERHVTITGSLDEESKIQIMKKSTIYTQISTYEGFGIAAIEALAAGNIVVHTGKGGLVDGIADYGVVIDNDSYKETANEIIELLRDKVKWSEKIDFGSKHVKENFNFRKRLKDFKLIFDSL